MYCWMISSGAPFKAMLVLTVWGIVCGKMALVMLAARTYFLTLMCCYRLRDGEGTEVDEDEAVYGIGHGVRCVSSTGSGRLSLWVIEDPREICITLSGRYSLSCSWDRRRIGVQWR